ncbi:MAG TPA: tetratricopeptide repeat protein [Candidatus Ozemobacteraceae bacterium]
MKPPGGRLIRCVLAFWLCALVIGIPAVSAEGPAAAPAPSAGEELLRRKAQLFVEKAQKAEQRGEFAEAAEAYEDAYEAFPGNVGPLLAWGDLLCRVGQYRQSQTILKRIPLRKLPPAGQARIHLMFAKIAAATGNVGEAAAEFGSALRAQPSNVPARLRLALVNEHLGGKQRAAELLEGVAAADTLRYRDNLILFVLQLTHVDLMGALVTSMILCEQLAAAPASVENPAGWEMGIQSFSPVYFVTSFPLGFSGFFGIIYAFLLLAGLAFMATRLAPAASFWGTCAFVGLGVAHVITAWKVAVPEFRLALLVDEFSIFDSQWILPRLLISMHLVTLLLFGIFPLFRLLPEKMRPRRNELYAIWFFCWWFSLFVLVFQSRLDLTVRLPGMLVSLGIAGVFSLWLPLGKYWMYRFAKVTGMSRLMPALGASSDPTSFTGAKLQEAQALSRLENEEFLAVLESGRKLFSLHDPSAFPEMWLAMIRSRIELEDLFEATQLLSEFQTRFGTSRHAPYGLLIEALLKSVAGDFAGAIKAVNEIPDDRARKFSGDDAAMSLLVTGRCMVAFNQGVQAHIDWTRGLDNARLPLVRAHLLAELAFQDFLMSRREWTDRWAEKAAALSGGPKTRALAKTVESIALATAGRMDDALKAAAEASGLFDRNGFSRSWQGSLLCRMGRYGEAETLLQQMAAGTASAESLMREITTKRS